MGVRHAHLPRDVRQAGRPQWRRRAFRGAQLRKSRRLDHGPQHVRAEPRAMARRRLAGLVGRGAALSRAGLRAHPPSARSDRDQGRHRLPLRHRRNRGGARTRARGRWRQGHTHRRRRRDGAPVSSGGADRRTPRRRVARSARRRRVAVRRARPPGARATHLLITRTGKGPAQ